MCWAYSSSGPTSSSNHRHIPPNGVGYTTRASPGWPNTLTSEYRRVSFGQRGWVVSAPWLRGSLQHELASKHKKRLTASMLYVTIYKSTQYLQILILLGFLKVGKSINNNTNRGDCHGYNSISRRDSDTACPDRYVLQDEVIELLYL